MESLPGRIEALELEQAKINAQLSDGSLYRDDPAAAKDIKVKLADITTEIDQALLRWEQLESLRA